MRHSLRVIGRNLSARRGRANSALVMFVNLIALSTVFKARGTTTLAGWHKLGRLNDIAANRPMQALAFSIILCP